MSLEEKVSQWRSETEGLQPSPALLARLEETLHAVGAAPAPAHVTALTAVKQPAGALLPKSKPAARPLARWASLAVACLVVVGAIWRGSHWVGRPPYPTAPPPEPSALTRTPITDSFGCGPDVKHPRCDMKVFSFEFVSASRMLVLLHFQSQDILAGDVILNVNGADVGRLPEDSLNPANVSHELVVPSDLLRRGRKNEFVFENVRNPPASERWRIWNLWVELVPLPEESAADLLRDANEAYRLGQLRLEQKDVGAENRYEAWRAFRRSWLLLESLPNPKPELYMLARTEMHGAQGELDHECQKLLMEVRQYYSHKVWDGARATLHAVEREFPGSDQICPARAAELRNELGL